MTTLHIFGDSFFEEWPWDQRYPAPATWQRQLSEKLNTQIQYHGLAGSSVDYTIKKYHQVLCNIKTDDYVIIGITNPARLYSPLQEKDGCAAALLMSDEQSRSLHGPHWKKAIETGVKWFLDVELNYYHILDFLHTVNLKSSNMLHKPLVVECFGTDDIIVKDYPLMHNISVAIGNLYDPCAGEFKTEQDKLHHEQVPGDNRANHFSPINHTILANKYYNYFTNGIPVDLTHGFVEKIVSLT